MKRGAFMQKKKESKQFETLENVIQGQILDAQQVYFRQLMDVYYSIGSPEFEEKLKAFQYSVEAHHRVKQDEEYKTELEEAIEEKDNPKELIDSMREPGYNKPISKIKETNPMLVFKAIMGTLGRNGLLYRKDYFQKL